MKVKEFKTESKKLMDLMINSIYTNKEVFLREIISNASDALDKLHYESLTNSEIKIDTSSFNIRIDVDKDKRTLTISDNGIGMSKEELENNLGTIAKSGSLDFKENNKKKKDIDIIGQFGVGFYSAFMVSSKVKVVSKKYGSDEAYSWMSEGVKGYSIEKDERENYGTDVILTIKEDTDDEKYSKFLEDYEIQGLIKKYSNYITYPIKMEVTHQHLKEKVNPDDKDEYETVTHDEVINDLIPIWKRNQKDIKDEEYDTFYSDKFFDYEKPIRHIHTKAEGTLEFRSLIYIPSHMPYDYYTKEYEKGLQLYSNGVLIMEKCPDLVPDYLSFIKGVVDSSDLPLNISRETIQQNRILATISKNIETKVLKELEDMQKNAREDYIKFYNAFGMQLKYGVYNDYGMNKDKLKDLLMFHSSKDKQFVTLKEYTERMEKEQKNIYYACGETVDKVDLIPQVEAVKNKGYEVLYCTDYVDEFAIKMLNKYADKEFKNVCTDSLELDSEKEIEKLKKKNEKSKDMFNIMKEAIPEIKDIRFTNKLSNHPVCLSSAGEISVEMEKALNSMPIDNKISAEKVLEINEKHKIAKKLNELYKEDKKTLKKYAKVLYAQARLIEGLSIENPTEISNLMAEIMSK
ncbi:MAG: molecular chaperone HtpG [bacterium]|nr:molecular chaperone HtpG [bacterium]MDY4108630.1 molecular chaperone HtpG [Bacilli bacterium]MDY4184073.1 molecular chaperone HtpG [Candidatus Onthovivens sp.]